MPRTFITMLLLSCLWINTYAADAVNFSSAYTDLSKDCKWLFKESELNDGQDNSLVCSGYDGFTLQIDASAMYDMLYVSKKKSTFSLSQTPILPDNKKGMIEWRMANMKPFAIIVRSLDVDKNGNAVSEHLAVLGLKDFEFISAAIKIKGNPHANEQARKLADTAYFKRLTK